MPHINDLRHEYLSRQIEAQRVEGGLSLEQGHLHIAQAVVVVPGGGGEYHFGLVTHLTLPVMLFGITFDAPDAIDALFELFALGTSSGGTPMIQQRLNLNKAEDPPFQSVAEGVTIDTVGALITSNLVQADKNAGGRAGVTEPLGFVPNVHGYFTITNNAVGDLTLSVKAFAGAQPETLV